MTEKVITSYDLHRLEVYLAFIKSYLTRYLSSSQPTNADTNSASYHINQLFKPFKPEITANERRFVKHIIKQITAAQYGIQLLNDSERWIEETLQDEHASRKPGSKIPNHNLNIPIEARKDLYNEINNTLSAAMDAFASIIGSEIASITRFCQAKKIHERSSLNQLVRQVYLSSCLGY